MDGDSNAWKNIYFYCLSLCYCNSFVVFYETNFEFYKNYTTISGRLFEEISNFLIKKLRITILRKKSDGVGGGDGYSIVSTKNKIERII